MVEVVVVGKAGASVWWPDRSRQVVVGEVGVGVSEGPGVQGG